MGITLVQQHELSQNGDFINRVRQAMAAVAVEVLTDDPTNYTVNGEYAAAKGLAQRVIRDSHSVAKQACYILVTHTLLNTTNPLNISDTSYLTVVRNSWNILAGFNTLDPDPEIL